MMPMTMTMPGSISGKRLMPSTTFFRNPLALRTVSTTMVPITEQMVAEVTARKMLFQMASRLLLVVNSSW